MNAELGTVFGGVALFAAFMPKPDVIRKADASSVSFAKSFRTSESTAALAIVGAGAIVGTSSKSARPVVLSVMIVAGMLALYEYHYRADTTINASSSTSGASEYTQATLSDLETAL